MLLSEAISHARECIRSGDTDAALALLSRVTLDQSTNNNLHLITARMSNLRQQQIRQTIDPEVAQRTLNQINDDLLRQLDQMERGNSSAVSNAKRSLRLIGIGITLLLLVGIVLFWWLNRVPAICTSFTDDSKVKVLIGPFVKVSGSNETLKPERLLQTEIEKKLQKAQIPTQIVRTETSTDGVECADWIVTAEYATYERDSLKIRLIYRSGHASALAQHTEFQGLTDITHMEKLRSLNDVTLALCSMMARAAGKHDFAEKWKQAIVERDRSDSRL
jgi:Effector-associated domain 11